jgi:hypothetical protein
MCRGIFPPVSLSYPQCSQKRQCVRREARRSLRGCLTEVAYTSSSTLRAHGCGGSSTAVTAQRFSEPDWGELDLTAVAEELSRQVSSVVNGDLRRVEAMLISQAHTLETLFHELARRAGLNMGGNLHAVETCLRLAPKAQSQCRATVETLAYAYGNPGCDRPARERRQARRASALTPTTEERGQHCERWQDRCTRRNNGYCGTRQCQAPENQGCTSRAPAV